MNSCAFSTQTQLYDAQMAKAKVERAEMSADFTKERLELHSQLLQARQQNEQLLAQAALFKEQLSEHSKSYDEMQKNMGDSAENFGHFR